MSQPPNWWTLGTRRTTRTRRNIEGPAAVGVRGNRARPAGVRCFSFHTFCYAATPRFVGRLGEERKNNKEKEKGKKRRNSKREELRNPQSRGLNRRQRFIIKTPTSSCSQTVAGRRTRGRRGRSPELCRFVSEGEKSAARSNRPLIFPSCVKGSALWGGRAGEAALLTFAVYLTPRFRWRIHTYAAASTVPQTQSRRNSGFLSQTFTGNTASCFL